MRDIEFGRTVRRLRMRKDWRQEDLARKASVSRQLVSRLERGQVGGMSIDRLREVARPLEMSVDLVPQWRGGDLLRVTSERHAVLTGALLEDLGRLDGWRWFAEVTFATAGGERGSADTVGWREADRALLIIEVKPELLDPHGHAMQVDRYRRAASAIAASIGVRPAQVGIILVTEETTTNRRRRAAHAQIYGTVLPDPPAAARAWMHSPGPSAGTATAAIAGTGERLVVRTRALLFVALTGERRRATRHLRKRVRPRSVPAP